MHKVRSRSGATVSFDKRGSGPPLVLVHGAFSDHYTNWEFVLPALTERFTVWSVARRGRGETDATQGHALEDEGADVAAVIEAVGEPVFLLGHSYGAHASLVAALLVPDRVRKMVLYEPAVPELLREAALAPLLPLAQAGDWDGFSVAFFRDVLLVPAAEVAAVRATPELWGPVVADAPASLWDLLAVGKYRFDAERFAGLPMPVLLHVGTESPRELYVTDALLRVLPNAREEALEGQAHEGMTTAPSLWVASVFGFLDDGVAREAVA